MTIFPLEIRLLYESLAQKVSRWDCTEKKHETWTTSQLLGFWTFGLISVPGRFHFLLFLFIPSSFCSFIVLKSHFLYFKPSCHAHPRKTTI